MAKGIQYAQRGIKIPRVTALCRSSRREYGRRPFMALMMKGFAVTAFVLNNHENIEIGYLDSCFVAELKHWDTMADKTDDPESTDIILLSPLQEAVVRVRHAIFYVIMAATFVVIIVGIVSTPTTEDAKFTIALAAFTGLNVTVGPTVSPAFTLKVRVKNPSAVLPWCSNGGKVIVSYSGVALAWGQVPVFCARRNAAEKLTVLPWGWEVGLSEDLRRRVVSEQRMGTAHVSVEMRLFSPDCWMHTGVCRVRSFYRFEPMLLRRDVDQDQIG